MSMKKMMTEATSNVLYPGIKGVYDNFKQNKKNGWRKCLGLLADSCLPAFTGYYSWRWMVVVWRQIRAGINALFTLIAIILVVVASSVWLVRRHLLAVKLWIDFSRIPLQCVRTITPERGWGGHFHTIAVVLSTPTSTRCHCLLECGKGLYPLLWNNSLS